MPYLGTRNIAIFSTDIDTFDFKLRRPDDVVKSAMTALAKNGKGILLMHDFQHVTAEAMPELLRQLKAGGYKIVHMVPKDPVTTLANYAEMVRAKDKYSTSNNARSNRASSRPSASDATPHCRPNKAEGFAGLFSRSSEIVRLPITRSPHVMI